MRHDNSVFHQLTKRIPWNVFDRAVAAHGADKGVRRLRTRDQFLALLFGQFSGASSLREIEAGLQSHRTRLYHANCRGVARATLSDANAKRPCAVFEETFLALAATASRGLRRKLRDPLRLIDATRIALPGPDANWAKGANGRPAIKVHVLYDPDTEIPRRAPVTGERVSDITAARDFPVEPGVTYVFDKAYHDFGWWAELEAGGCVFVTPLKSGTRLRDVTERPVPEGGAILSDRTGLLSERMKGSRQNPYSRPVREVTVQIDETNTLRLVTNNLDAPAEEIAALYKRRWDIEIFFKWIKQNLRIKRFLGQGENAVRLQIYVALIAYVLLHLAHKAQKAIPSGQAFCRLARLNIMHRRDIADLTRTPILRPPDPNQPCLDLLP